MKVMKPPAQFNLVDSFDGTRMQKITFRQVCNKWQSASSEDLIAVARLDPWARL